ncbi:hypothetical protein AB0J71_10400 [Nonomuraea sp. NPDC049637]|uniref:hypothetical protein n=1 Tax=Nonomuraea sp. NPDC049637 TaxID=3154356 RepID=UPI0034229964
MSGEATWAGVSARVRASLPDLGVGRRGDHAAALTAEQPPVRGDAELCDVLSKDLDQFWWDRDAADVILSPVLETAPLVSIAGVGPSTVHLGARAVESEPSPALRWEVAVLLAEADGLAGSEGGEIHAGEHGHQPLPSALPATLALFLVTPANSVTDMRT